jgi:hypothetical protein
MLPMYKVFQSDHHACAEDLKNCQSGMGQVMLANGCVNPTLGLTNAHFQVIHAVPIEP